MLDIDKCAWYSNYATFFQNQFVSKKIGAHIERYGICRNDNFFLLLCIKSIAWNKIILYISRLSRAVGSSKCKDVLRNIRIVVDVLIIWNWMILLLSKLLFLEKCLFSIQKIECYYTAAKDQKTKLHIKRCFYERLVRQLCNMENLS